MKELKLVVIGISGRMGQEITALAPDFNCKVVTGVASKTAATNVVTSIWQVEARLCDVVVDFSHTGATEAVADWCRQNAKPLVSGVTGHGENEMRALSAASKSIAVFWAPNMSLGIAVLERMLAQAKALESFDWQVEEFHHAGKKDRPSGTALLLQTVLTQSVKEDVPAPIAIRGGGVFGIHRVFAMGEEEMLTFEHVAMNRRVFARGALTAARWLVGRGPGLYAMKDLLADS